MRHVWRVFVLPVKGERHEGLLQEVACHGTGHWVVLFLERTWRRNIDSRCATMTRGYVRTWNRKSTAIG